MAILGSILAIIFLFGGPCAIAVWIASRVRRPLIAFVLAWVLTPIAYVLAGVVYAPFVPAGNDGTWAIMLPLYGIAMGLVFGIVAAVIVVRKRSRESQLPSAGESPETPVRIEGQNEMRP